MPDTSTATPLACLARILRIRSCIFLASSPPVVSLLGHHRIPRLGRRYVLPVLGEDVLWPHTEFDGATPTHPAARSPQPVACSLARPSAWLQIGHAVWRLTRFACCPSSPRLRAADNKRVALWLKKKDEVKRFQNAVKESRLTAWRHAGAAHLALRMSLCTKLSRAPQLGS